MSSTQPMTVSTVSPLFLLRKSLEGRLDNSSALLEYFSVSLSPLQVFRGNSIMISLGSSTVFFGTTKKDWNTILRTRSTSAQNNSDADIFSSSSSKEVTVPAQSSASLDKLGYKLPLTLNNNVKEKKKLETELENFGKSLSSDEKMLLIGLRNRRLLQSDKLKVAFDPLNYGYSVSGVEDFLKANGKTKTKEAIVNDLIKLIKEHSSLVFSNKKQAENWVSSIIKKINNNQRTDHIYYWDKLCQAMQNEGSSFKESFNKNFKS